MAADVSISGGCGPHHDLGHRADSANCRIKPIRYFSFKTIKILDKDDRAKPLRGRPVFGTAVDCRQHDYDRRECEFQSHKFIKALIVCNINAEIGWIPVNYHRRERGQYRKIMHSAVVNTVTELVWRVSHEAVARYGSLLEGIRNVQIL
jgi:hypothetical protein